MFLKTQLGIMLLGNTEQYLSDMPYLPMASKSSSTLSMFSHGKSNLVTTSHVASTVNDASFLDNYLKNDITSVSLSDLDEAS